EDHEMGTGALRTDFRYFRRTEAAREGELGLIVHLLIAKDENRMFFKSPAHRRIGGAIGCDLRHCHAAQLHGEPWTQRYDIHRRHSSPFFLLNFPANPARWQATRNPRPVRLGSEAGIR